MKFAICDDEAKHLSRVIEAANEYISQRPEHNITFDTFSHPEDLLGACEKNGGYDIYILDIVMPDMNGIQLGERLRDNGADGKIIYLTSSSEYSLDAFKVKAFNYLIKPIETEKFFQTLDEAISEISIKKDKHIIVKTKDRSIKISYDSIAYAELTKRAIFYHLLKGKIIESVTLRIPFAEACKEMLSDSRFYLCTQGLLINLDHITEIENDAAVFADGTKAFIGEKTCRKLRSVWSNYLFS